MARRLQQSFDTFSEAVGLLRTRRFGTFWFACLLSNIGTWAQQVAQPWLLLSIGASPVLVGLDAFAMDAPGWMLTLVGGVLADRADRRRVIALFQSLQMLCPLVLVALLLTDTVQPWMVIVLSLLVGITDALSMPSFQSIVPSIVEPERIAAGLALNSTQFNLSRILGPALAGVLLAGIGAVACYAVNAASYIPFILVALWILPRRMPSADKPPPLRQLLGGLHDLLRRPALRDGLLTVLATGTLCGPLITFCPVLVKQVFHGGAGQFSAAVGAFGIGGLLGATGLLAVDPQRDRRRLSAAFAALYGAVVVAAALSPWAWCLSVLLVLAGACMSIANTSASTYLMTSVEPALRGQAVSLYMLALRGGASIGGLLTGFAVSAFGARQALVFDGALAVIVQLLIGSRWAPWPRQPRGAAA